PVRLTQVGVNGGRLRGVGDGPADQVEGTGSVARLEGHHAKQVEGVGVRGVAGEDRLIRAGRPVQVALLVVPNGCGEGVVHGRRPGSGGGPTRLTSAAVGTRRTLAGRVSSMTSPGRSVCSNPRTCPISWARTVDRSIRPGT